MAGEQQLVLEVQKDEQVLEKLLAMEAAQVRGADMCGGGFTIIAAGGAGGIGIVAGESGCQEVHFPWK